VNGPFLCPRDLSCLCIFCKDDIISELDLLTSILWRGGNARSLFIVSPNFAGWSTITTLAPSNAVHLSWAEPSPGPAHAPACPNTLPGIAQIPPTNAAIGLIRLV